MEYKGQATARKQTGLTYLGMINNSFKHEKAYKYNEYVYTLYLAPGNMSGFEDCPMRTKECTKLCLNESGHNRIDTKRNHINNSRIKKTKLFFEHRDFFMNWMVDEIISAKNKAARDGAKFSIRLNNTSDISPLSFYKDVNGKKVNILDMFPDVQFYDYTKVPNRFRLTEIYKNYDVTFSYNGSNLIQCFEMLERNIRVAMVFSEVPESFFNYKVINGDLYDMRYTDEKNVIVGLKFKKVRTKLNSENTFVIQL